MGRSHTSFHSSMAVDLLSTCYTDFELTLGPTLQHNDWTLWPCVAFWTAKLLQAPRTGFYVPTQLWWATFAQTQTGWGGAGKRKVESGVPLTWVQLSWDWSVLATLSPMPPLHHQGVPGKFRNVKAQAWLRNSSKHTPLKGYQWGGLWMFTLLPCTHTSPDQKRGQDECKPTSGAQHICASVFHRLHSC